MAMFCICVKFQGGHHGGCDRRIEKLFFFFPKGKGPKPKPCKMVSYVIDLLEDGKNLTHPFYFVRPLRPNDNRSLPWWLFG